ncbi:hypothetical protein F5887DRAFT_1197076 [Amanita rubescens]|nr:hypothetical protein F5887DRAFT_1197076 [Amanita rubescens]
MPLGASAICPRQRTSKPRPYIPVPPEQRAQRRETNRERREEVNAAIIAWETYTLSKAEELAERFKRRPRYFLDLFYQSTSRLASRHEKANGFNLYKRKRIAEMRELGITANLIEIQPTLVQEWNAMTPEQKTQIVEEEEEEWNAPVIKRPSARSRILDVTNVKRNMQALLSSLKMRVGIEGFFCIVRNTTEFNMAPTWFFTSAELEAYMDIAVRRKWDATEIGSRLEAFAIAGCDATNFCKTSKEKADALKREIRQLLNANLAQITGDSTTTMQYVRYEEEIIHKRGVELVGWTYDKIVNPSQMSSALEPLSKLRNAIKEGRCKFVRLTQQEIKERIAAYDNRIEKGEMQARKRKTRKDKGKRRNVPQASLSDEDDSDGEEGRPSKRRQLGTGDDDSDASPLES